MSDEKEIRDTIALEVELYGITLVRALGDIAFSAIIKDTVDNIVKIIKNGSTEELKEKYAEARKAKDFVETMEYLMKNTQNKEILNKLGSDYDEDGIPYWEKWNEGRDGNDK
jgi:hypothetical protein